MSTDLYAPVSKQQDDVVIVAIKMPKSLREEFKAHCNKFNLDMSEVVRRFMKAEVEKGVSK